MAYFNEPKKAPHRSAQDEGHIYVMNADGSGKHLVGPGAHPEWSSIVRGPAPLGISVLGLPRRCVKKTFKLRVVARGGGPVTSVVYLDRRLFARGPGARFPVYIFAGSMRRGRHRLEIKMARGPEKAKRTVSFKRC